MLYLQRFGYMNESVAANLVSEKTYSDAVLEFQRFAGLNQTGLLDDETIQTMNSPRCGNKDKVGHSEDAKRRKRYALQGSKWRRIDLTYRISQYPTKFLSKKQEIDKEMARAFKIWSEVTPLTFEAKKEGRVHIDIRFVSAEHGDGDPFDGPGNTLAHAYFPQYGGDAHFDNEEYWTISSYAGTNVFQVAAHELGHSLGLGHSSVRDSLMAPFYQKYKPKFRLHQDDILAIQALYGVRHTASDPADKPVDKPKPLDPDPSADGPDLCQDSSVDAVTRISDGTTYVFKGQHYWKIETTGIADGYPRKISSDWDGLPGNLDSALTWADGKTFFFKGDKYWRFKNMHMDKGYPKPISTGFAGIPDKVGAAFVWSGNGKTYFFKGNEYWRFDSKNDPPVSKQYPKPIKNWNGLPNNIDAAFKWENGMSYFFKGSQYFRFNDVDFEVDTKAKPPFPRQTAQWWFDCQAASRKQKKGSIITRSGSLVKDDKHTVYVGNGDSNDMEYMADERTSTSKSMDAHIVKVDKDDKEWRMHGRPDQDEVAMARESGTTSISSLSCKTNPILMLFLFISIFKYVLFYGSATGDIP
ncbi:stromelysin-3-like [Oppia nitens]|uniref:stromelysin-3-like n=1 Tax=Oppia nitens TaxID=1686743 RepID=UPI0023DBBF15|nr:stromelysin-3-like [Oppia nitens]